MKILTLTLKNFRNIAFEKINFNDGVNVLVGKNAQGKTNILEAICFCSYLKSFRSCRDEQLIKTGCDSAKITLDYESGGELNKIEIEIFKDRPKELKKNGISVTKNRELIGQFMSIVFTPDHLNLIKEGPNKRRSFLDMALCALDIKYTDSLIKYQKILMQRNALLRKLDGIKGEDMLLDVYDSRLAKEGSYISFSRAKYLETLEPFARDYYSKISRSDSKLKILYINQFVKNVESREQIESAMLERYRNKRESDIAMKMTGSGIQKDDFLVLSGGKSLKFFGSQGQIRSAVLSLILAQSDVINEKNGVFPVIILDDILSELDRTRRAFIFEGTGNAQCILSTCESQKVKNRGNILKVSKGRIV